MTDPLSVSHRNGSSLIELLVVLVVISILSAIAIPFAESRVIQHKEIALRETLRETRNAIDAFHEDWKNGKISKVSGQASEDGYPLTLSILVDGVILSGAAGDSKRYLRRLPENPFAKPQEPMQKQWNIISYRDIPGMISFGPKDVYDIRANTHKKALDGSLYENW